MSATPSRPARRARRSPLGPPVLLLAIMWALELVDAVLRGRLDAGGIRPRDSDALLGILAAPFLHLGFEHLLANTVPLLVLGTLVATAGRGVFWSVTATVAVLGGLGTWLVAPPGTVTIGASGLVFGYLAYLLVAGVRTRHWRDLLIGLAVLLLYGGMLVGALPWGVAAGVSWQGHLMGAVAGGAAAWWFAPRPTAAPTAAGPWPRPGRDGLAG